jgi:hypothetical protein
VLEIAQDARRDRLRHVERFGGAAQAAGLAERDQKLELREFEAAMASLRIDHVALPQADTFSVSDYCK